MRAVWMQLESPLGRGSQTQDKENKVVNLTSRLDLAGFKRLSIIITKIRQKCKVFYME
jgi:hypothetical protein